MKFPALYINKGAVSNTVRLALAFSLIILTCGDVESNPGPTLPPDHQADARQTRSSSSSLRQTTLTSPKTQGSKPLNLEYLNNEFSLIKQEVTGLKTEVNKLRSENEALRKNVQYLEDQSRRDNLISNSIEESENETWDEQKVRDIMADNLNIENARNDADVGIERAHRLNVKHRQPNRPRPVIVKFSRFKTRDTILKKAREKSKNRSDVNYRISEDFSADVRRIRRDNIPFLLQAHEEEKRAFLSYDKLVIDGTKFILGDA